MSSSPTPVRIGVIGFGQWGPNHVRNFQMIDGAEVVRVGDSSETRLKAARKLFRDVQFTTSAADITHAKDVDAVVIATPTGTHHALVKAALEAGKDVLCEKPLARTSAECRELMELAAKHGRILMVGHVFLYNPGVLHLKVDLDRGELGRIYYMDAVRTNLGPVRTDVGAIFDLASHDISIFNFLLGALPLEVSATGNCVLQKNVEDVGFLTLQYPGNVVCHAHTSWLNPRKVRQLTIVGDHKMAVWDDMNNLEPIRYYDKGVTADHYASFGEFHMILRDGQITIPKVKLSEPLMKQDAEFVECVRSRRTPASDGRMGLAVVLAMEAALASLANRGQAVKIVAP
ncbi:MAG TPA: Gfo/Idh/MocA family oxidoreductase [Lacunisphaera sp.]|jgi:predicted dehydrogenase|nr:Gfo/Idh/MocA family oxidoreductase [Lacunisphaera sp.]